MGFLWDFYKKIYGVRKKASPFRGGGTAERRDGEVAADLRRPLRRLRRQLPLIGEAFYPKKQGAAFAAPCLGYVGN